MTNYKRIGVPDFVRLLTLVLLAAISSQAAAVTLISDDRIVYHYSDDDNSTQIPSSNFGYWSSTYQTTSVEEDGFEGVGYGTGYSDFFYSIYESVFDITFSIATSTLIDLQGSLTGYDGSFGLGLAKVELFAGASTSDALMFGESGGSGDFVTFDFLQILDPGVYRLVVQTNIIPGGFSTSGDWTFSANFTEVPIPAMGWVFLLAVLGLRKFSHA